ncbi:PorT family protein [Flavihumibacter rivuli]|uniref:type IX secretion system protein PorG n=1 Tax=Flavihumibacter rivuli TaxID=2838156 RepID=UPI001BDE26A1|nr:DUF6089 family protein [Flavihumibacter rivuli]ULQ57640.1 PorT family protein [Flavihumibacter rivuli]
MRTTILLLLAVLPLTLMAQRWHITGFGGLSNYQGDLQEKRITTNQANGAFGLGVQYDLNPKLSLRGGLVYGKLSGDDKKNTDSFLVARNLNFTSPLLEGHILAEYRFFDLDNYRFTPYVFAGLGIFGFEPYTFDTTGQKYYLQPLGTEGQGLSIYPDRKPYKRVQVALPFGAGLKFRLNEMVTLGYEIGWRKTFTDYIDDVSTTYVDPAALLAERGPKAVELSYRGGELKDGNPNYPADGTVRGGSKVKDWYYFQGITVGVRLGSGSGPFSGGGGGKRSRQTDCPRNVF